ncbi:hypothetical protein SPOG_04326 [Schizosaccharomyces cryophilus OY26]|uniref:Uncharacterized protein n=1 Tax=Schizosaccharomyces cryophilus (strain OY26 / ATCC MYA-4695 / CBS 11777 / NBRC 106824 / NRRL Y48691) TaxID=653667 RepID=S9VN17_SCHCR|nr:uncharacterized protein SPOG_04326 [Schizosaccharomyces cryophilus OY26]EPY49323.1 hypothetical protein SPOG_04326 [Schizosaccharomyces cryophilus OY26]
MSSVELGRLHIYVTPEQWEEWSPQWKRLIYRNQYESIFKHSMEVKPFQCLLKLSGVMKCVPLSHMGVNEHRLSNKASFAITTLTSSSFLNISLQFRSKTIPHVVGEAEISLDEALTEGLQETILPLKLHPEQTEAYVRVKLVYIKNKRKRERKKRVPSSFQRYSNRHNFGVHPPRAYSATSLKTLPMPQKQVDLLQFSEENELQDQGYRPVHFVFMTTPFSPSSFDVPKTFKA